METRQRDETFFKDYYTAFLATTAENNRKRPFDSRVITTASEHEASENKSETPTLSQRLQEQRELDLANLKSLQAIEITYPIEQSTLSDCLNITHSVTKPIYESFCQALLEYRNKNSNKNIEQLSTEDKMQAKEAVINYLTNYFITKLELGDAEKIKFINNFIFLMPVSSSEPLFDLYDVIVNKIVNAASFDPTKPQQRLVFNNSSIINFCAKLLGNKEDMNNLAERACKLIVDSYNQQNKKNHDLNTIRKEEIAAAFDSMSKQDLTATSNLGLLNSPTASPEPKPRATTGLMSLVQRFRSPTSSPANSPKPDTKKTSKVDRKSINMDKTDTPDERKDKRNSQ